VFVQDVARRILNRIQLTTDGHPAYLDAVDEAWATDIDYAMLQKLYGAEPENTAETRCSPAKMHRHSARRGKRESRSAAREHELRRAPEFNDPHVESALYEAH